jgi:probable F420-dependent oxidoreductase
MKFWANTSFSPPEHNVPLALAAEEAGLTGILMSDHMIYPRDLMTPYPYSPYEDGRPIWEPEVAWPDVWVTIGAMQAVTIRLHFGTGVYVAPARDLLTVAKQVGTAAVLSGNRVHLGVGAGWMKEEFDLMGQPYDNRGRRLDEMIPALRASWKGGWVEYHGEHYDFGPLRIEPAPSAMVPIWSGGHSEPALRRAARLCDGWIGSAYSPEDAQHYIGKLQQYLAEAGRAGDPFEIIIGLYPALALDMVEEASRWGVTGLMCLPWFVADRSDDSDVPGVQGSVELERKVEATLRFGEEVIAPAAQA